MQFQIKNFLYICVCVEIFGKQQASVLKPFFFFFWGWGGGGKEGDQGFTECVQGILPGRRSKNKRWGGLGFAFID